MSTLKMYLLLCFQDSYDLKPIIWSRTYLLFFQHAVFWTSCSK